MEQEIELKLLAPQNAGQVIEQRVLPRLNATVSKQQVELGNYYFDTAKRELRALDIGLRIRKNADQYEQTLKTAGKSMGALHQRPEYNVDLEGGAVAESEQGLCPVLALFPDSAWPEGFDLKSAQHNLQTLFNTDFTRTIYLVNISEKCQIEMVFDQGLISAKGKTKPICEIELELKKGQASDLFELAEELLKAMYLAVGSDSKAARGYRLADNLTRVPPELTAVNLEQLTNLPKQDVALYIENALACFQYYCHSLSHGLSDQGFERLKGALQRLKSLLGMQHFHSEFDTILTEVEQLSRQADGLTTQFGEWSDSEKQDALNQTFMQSHVTLLQLHILRVLIDSAE